MNEKLVLVGIEGVAFDVLDAKLRAGGLPVLARHVAAGEFRPLISPVSPGSPAAWASLSTGVLPDRHGIVVPDEPWAGGVRPATRQSWRFAPIWGRLAQGRIATASLAWPGIMPGADWPGEHVDARHGYASGITRDDWPLPLDIAPPDLREHLRDTRVHPSELPAEVVTPLVAQDRSLGPAQMNRLLTAVARTASLQAATFDTVQHSVWQSMFIHIDWLAAAAAAIDAPVEALPDAAWALLDHWLGAMPASETIMIVSLGEPAPGFVIANGRDFRSGLRGPGVSILAIAPSILKHFGFADRSLARPLQSVPRHLQELPPGEREVVPASAPSEDGQRLAANGIAASPTDPMWRQRRLLAEAEIALASDVDRAAALAEEALAAGPDVIAALGILAAARVAKGDGARLPELAERIAAIDPDHPWCDLVLGAAFALAGDEGKARPHLLRAGQSEAIDDRLRAASIWLILDRRVEAARLFRAALDVVPQHLGALLGLLSTQTVRDSEAEALLRRVLTLQPDHREAKAALASLLRSLGRSIEAGRIDGPDVGGAANAVTS